MTAYERADDGTEFVQGYVRSDGTIVSPYVRSAGSRAVAEDDPLLAQQTATFGRTQRRHHKQEQQVSHELVLARNALKSDIWTADFSHLQQLASTHVGMKALDATIAERVEVTRHHTQRLAELDPYNAEFVHSCDTSTFKTLRHDVNDFRDRTAQMVEAVESSPLRTHRYSDIPDDSHVGKAVKIHTYEPNTLPWLRERFDTVGGSDVAALVMVDFHDDSPWKDAAFHRVERSKMTMPTSEQSFEQHRTGALYRGTVWESRIRDEYAADHPEEKVYLAKSQYQSPQYAWQRVNLDGVLSRQSNGRPDGVLEIKTGSSLRAWSQGIPVGYRAQMLYYLNATGLDYAVVRAKINDSEAKDFELRRDDEIVVGSGLNMQTYIDRRVAPWFAHLRAQRK